MVSYNILFKREEPYLFIQLNLVQSFNLFSQYHSLLLSSQSLKTSKDQTQSTFFEF